MEPAELCGIRPFWSEIALLPSYTNCIEIFWKLCIQVVTPSQLEDNEEYQEILEDMKTECGKYGTCQIINRATFESGFQVEIGDF